MQIDPNVPLWPFFENLSRIPRPSKHEAAVKAWIRNLFAGTAIRIHEDEAGNLLLRKPAHPDMTDTPGVILQSHLDMVPQKRDGSTHDFTRDPVELVRDGDWLHARDTTLGADNGIGVAAILAVFSDPAIRHGPLEALLTVDEEAGMSGAQGAQTDWFEGHYLLNLDTEEENELYIGCAGGVDVVVSATLPASGRQQAGWQIGVHGLRGGHSGIDIHRQRGNAIRILAELLQTISHEWGPLEVAQFSGGTLRNAIARSAEATLGLPTAPDESALQAVTDHYRTQWQAREPGIRITLTRATISETTPADTSHAWLDALLRCPHGVLAMSPDFEGVVHTSANLGVVHWTPGQIRVDCLPRSLDDQARDEAAEKIGAVFAALGARIERQAPYPGWTPRPDSPLLQRARQLHEQVLGVPAGIQVIHAGLECGLLGKKAPHWDMISFGPTIQGAHSPDERVNIPSVARFWRFLLALLERIGT